MTDTTDTTKDDTGRCAVLTLPSFKGDLPEFRCIRRATTLRDGRNVCAGHARQLAVRFFCDEVPS
jgi:hypothetical protein